MIFHIHIKLHVGYNTDTGWLFRGECQHSVRSRGEIGCILQGT